MSLGLNIKTTSIDIRIIESNVPPFKDLPNLIWNKTFGGSSSDYGFYIQQTRDSGYMINLLQHYKLQKSIGLISAESGSIKSSNAPGDTTLIADIGNDRVIEIDYDGNIVWEVGGFDDIWDVERLDNGNTLIADGEINRVIEIDYNGNIVWQKTGLNNTLDAERLDNGNTLIVEAWGDRVIEVDYNGNIVWQKIMDAPVDAERLDNGNTLIVDAANGRVIEVDYNGNIVWQKTGLPYTLDAERLDNGNTLIADSNNFRVIEVDYNGHIVWQFTALYGVLWDVERLDNGNTLIADLEFLYEVDYNGNIAWWTYDYVPLDAERLYYAPCAPSIDGSASGKPGILYKYTFTSIDPNGDKISYYVDWGDNRSTGWFGPFASGSPQTKSHRWWEQDTYIIKAKAKDINGLESDWGTLEVTIPRNRATINSYWMRFLDQFPNLLSILRHLLGLH